MSLDRIVSAGQHTISVCGWLAGATLQKDSRSRWGLAAALICTAVVMYYMLAPRPTSTLASSPAGLWHGTSHVRRSLDAKYFVETLDYDADFWFRVDGQGSVTGQAVMRYGISMDDQKLRALLTWAHSMGTSAAGMVIPEIAAVLGTGKTIGDVVGLRMAFDDAMPARSGHITGGVTNDTIHLQWVDPPTGVPYKLYREYPTHEVVISQKEAPAVNAWPVDASIQTSEGGDIAWVPAGAVNRRNGDAQFAVYWIAFRVAKDPK